MQRPSHGPYEFSRLGEDPHQLQIGTRQRCRGSIYRLKVIDNRCRRRSRKARMRIARNSEGGEYNNEHTFKHPWLPYTQARGKLRNETRRVTAKRVRRIRQENERRDRRILGSFVSVSAASDCPAELEIFLWGVVVGIVAYLRSFKRAFCRIETENVHPA